MNPEVKVEYKKGDTCIYVAISNITFQSGNLFGVPSVSIFLRPEIAEKLQSFLNATLEDISRMKEEENHKYREAPTAEDVARSENE